jgi:hypothetical protein
MHPALVIATVAAVVFEIWIIFALMYAALQRYDGRNYLRRVKDALQLRL